MKSLIATGLVLCAGIVGSLAPATSAYAESPIMHAGQICHARFDSKTANFSYSTVGITADVSNAGEVICPLVIKKDVSGGLSVDVSVSGNGPNAGSTKCSLASHDWTGEFLGVAVGTINPPAQFVRLTLNGNQTRTFAHYSVSCFLPPFQTLTNITVFD